MEVLDLKTVTLNFDRKAGRFILDRGEPVFQTMCEFLHTFSFLVVQDIEQFLLNTDSRYDVIRVPLTASGSTATLSLAEFLEMRKAYGYQMYLLRLEDVLCRKGIASNRLF